MTTVSHMAFDPRGEQKRIGSTAQVALPPAIPPAKTLQQRPDAGITAVVPAHFAFSNWLRQACVDPLGEQWNELGELLFVEIAEHIEQYAARIVILVDDAAQHEPKNDPP